MSLFDLLFIACFLGAVFCAGRIGWLLLRRRWVDARRSGARLGFVVGGYLVVLIVVGLASPRRVLGAHEVLRYDDWCLGVVEATFADAIGTEVRPVPGHRFLIVTLNVISEARRVRQAAPAGASVYVVDNADTRFAISERGQAGFEKLRGVQPALTTTLDPQSALRTTRVFEVPRDAGELWLGHQHGSGARFPGMLIIGQGFCRPPVVQLSPSDAAH